MIKYVSERLCTLQNNKMCPKKKNKKTRRVSYKLMTLVSKTYCRESHFLYKCTKFLQLNFQNRIDIVKKSNL